jgi:hypothetical protein
MTTDSETAEFRLAYQGKALDENTMDVKDLAPALIAFGELFTRANLLLNGKDISVSLKVKATKPGSFELYLLLSQAFFTTTQFLSGDMVTSASNLLSLVTGVPKVGSSLFGVFKKLKGQKPVVIEQPNGVTLKASNIELLVPTEVFRLYQDNEVKRLSQAIVEPLYREGINKMVIKDRNKELESIDKEDAPHFLSSNVPVEGGLENIIPNQYLKLVSPTFDLKKTKWRFDDGGGSKWYSVEDQHFLKDVREHRKRFGWGDYLLCRVRTVQRVREKGLQIERTILVVIEQIIAGEQLPFDKLR